MKRVLITGISGFIGHHVMEHIQKNTDWEIVGLVTMRHKGDSLRLENLDPKRTTLYTHDLNWPISDRLIEKIGKIDYILNLASESHVDRSIEDPVPFIENNVRVVLNMLEYAREAKPEIFIQMSTDEVYGPAPKGQTHKEWSPVIPSNPYSGSKAAQEAIAISYWRTYGVPLVIVNSMNLIGERQDKEKFVPMVISKVSKGETVTIHGTPEQIGSRFYQHCRNLADALAYIISKLPHSVRTFDAQDANSYTPYPSRFNVVGEKELNNLEMAQLIASYVGKPLKYELVDFHSSRPGHDPRYGLDGSYLASFGMTQTGPNPEDFTIGWKAPLTLEESLKKTVDWTKEHPEWL